MSAALPERQRLPRRVWREAAFRDGVRDMAPLALALSAWGLVTGVAMVDSGLSVPVALLMSLVVFAGSAQLAALPLMASGGPIWVVWATALCVNLRFVIFSAQLRPYFSGYPLRTRLALGYFMADTAYVQFLRRFPDPQPHPDQAPYHLGGSAINWIAWQAPSVAGILLGDSVPTSWGLGFAGTVALLGLTCTLLKGPATYLAAAVAAAAAIAAYALPLKLNIVIAITAAVTVGILIDHTRQARRRRAAELER